MPNAKRLRHSAPLKQIMSAVRAIETREYKRQLLSDVWNDGGDMGQLAHTLDAMARNVALRDNQLQLLRKVIPIGVALSAEKDFNRLLETLVIEAQFVTNADAGTLYLLENKTLKFVILRNASLNLMMGGTSDQKITFAPLRLYNDDGDENRANVASCAALTRKRVSVADAYQAEGFDFSGTKIFDSKTGYRSKSFLTTPLINADEEVIGVLQLINAKNQAGEIIPFEDDDVLESLILLATAALDGYIREATLRQEIVKLKIEIDETRRARQVSEITDTVYFKRLKDKANEFKSK